MRIFGVSSNYLLFFWKFLFFFRFSWIFVFFLDIFPIWWYNNIRKFTGSHKSDAVIAQLVEHFLGKEEVTSSNLVNSSTKPHAVSVSPRLSIFRLVSTFKICLLL